MAYIEELISAPDGTKLYARRSKDSGCHSGYRRQSAAQETHCVLTTFIEQCSTSTLQRRPSKEVCGFRLSLLKDRNTRPPMGA